MGDGWLALGAAIVFLFGVFLGGISAEAVTKDQCKAFGATKLVAEYFTCQERK